MVVFDTFALVKFLKKEKGHDQVKEALRQGGQVSEATWYELFYVTTRDILEQGHDLDESLRRAEEVLESLSPFLKKQNLSIELSRRAIWFKVKYNKRNLSHFDCLALATAEYFRQPLLSGEKGLAMVTEVKVLG